MKKLLIVIFTLFFLTGFSQENYKLGNFKSSVVQMKKAKIGNDWIMYKNSANSGLYITYQGTTELYLTSGGNLTATGTISGTGAGTFTSLSFGTTPQTIVETNLNMATFNNSLKVTDTLFIGSAQWLRQSSTNRLTSEGSIAAADTLLGAQATITTKITLGSQQLTQSHTNNVSFNNSLTATDTVFAATVSTTGNILGLGTRSHLSGAGGAASGGTLTLSTNGTPQLVLNDLDAADAQEPMWYFQSANNASKGIFYLGYGDRSSGIVMTGYTDVMLVDASSFTLGAVIGTGTQALYAGDVTISGQTLSQGTTNRLDVENSLDVADSLYLGSAQYMWQPTINRIQSEGSFTATDTLSSALANITTKLTLGAQQLTQNHVNNVLFNNSITATDTVFGPVTSVSTKLLVGAQPITQNHVNNTLFGNSVTATDTLFGPVTSIATKLLVGSQAITQNHVNNTLFGNSITATDTLFAPVVRPTTNLTIGTQVLTQKNTNGITWNNSITATDTVFCGVARVVTDVIAADLTATNSVKVGSIQTITQTNPNKASFNNSLNVTDTVFGGVISSTGNLSATGITGSTLPTFTIAAGTATPVLLADTVGFAVSGLTASAIVIVCYAELVGAPDTVAQVHTVRAGWLTLMGENSKAINYWIPKK